MWRGQVVSGGRVGREWRKGKVRGLGFWGGGVGRGGGGGVEGGGRGGGGERGL